MKKIIAAGVLLAVLYILRSYGEFYSVRFFINVLFVILSIYLIIVIIQYVTRPVTIKNAVHGIDSPPSSTGSTLSSPWFVGFIVVAVMIYLLRRTLGRNSFEAFLFSDNLFKFFKSFPPFVGWILPGILVGAIYGSIVAWKKYKLNFLINFFPITAFVLIVLLMVLLNDPLSNDLPDKITNQTDTEINKNAGGSLEKLLLNRWQMVDITGKNKKNLLQRNKKLMAELEFKDNGKCYLYENGVTTGFVFYTVGSDGKSMQFSDPVKKDQTSLIEIISITKNEMILRSQMFGNETATFKVM